MVTDRGVIDGLPTGMTEESLRKRLLQTCTVILHEAPAAAPAVLEQMAAIWGQPVRRVRSR